MFSRDFRVLPVFHFVVIHSESLFSHRLPSFSLRCSTLQKLRAMVSNFSPTQGGLDTDRLMEVGRLIQKSIQVVVDEHGKGSGPTESQIPSWPMYEAQLSLRPGSYWNWYPTHPCASWNIQDNIGSPGLLQSQSRNKSRMF